jgi:hypothetical protein
MARQPFFRGNYGSALAQVDTRPIMQGAAAQAAAYQGMGQTFAGEIEKYQLNKEKNLELDGQIEGTLAGLKDEDSFDFEIELQNNSVMRKLFEKQSKGETGQAEKAKLAGYLSSRSKQQDLQRLRAGQDIATQLKQQNFGLNKQLEAGIIKNQELTNNQRRIAQSISGIELENLPEKTRLAIEGLKVNLENAITSGKGLKQDLEYTTDIRSALPGRAVGEAKSDELKDATATRKRKNEIADALFDASGGAAGMAKMSMEDRKLRKDQILLGMEGDRSQMKANQWSALAKFAPPTVKQQAADLAADQGRLLGLMLRDPITKGEITFKKYLELNNTEGDDQYPLKKPAAGTAATYHGRYVTGQRQLQELYDGVQVQANKTGTVGGTGGGTGVAEAEAQFAQGDVNREAAYGFVENMHTPGFVSYPEQSNEAFQAILDAPASSPQEKMQQLQNEIAEIERREAELGKGFMENYSEAREDSFQFPGMPNLDPSVEVLEKRRNEQMGAYGDLKRLIYQKMQEIAP